MRNLSVEEMNEVSGGTFFGIFRFFRSFWGNKSGHGYGGSKGGHGGSNGGGKGGSDDNGGGKGGNGGGKYGC